VRARAIVVVGLVACGAKEPKPIEPAPPSNVAPPQPAPSARCGAGKFESYESALREDVVELASGERTRPMTPERTGAAQKRVAEAGDRALDAVAAYVDELDSARLAKATPTAVVLAARSSPKALATTRCLVDRAAKELARARAAKDAAAVRAFEDQWIGLRLTADVVELGRPRPCEHGECPDDEICLERCSVGPSTPPIPMCQPAPPNMAIERVCAAAGCAKCAGDARKARCLCGPTPF
jgi:hypothetical protein